MRSVLEEVLKMSGIIRATYELINNNLKLLLKFYGPLEKSNDICHRCKYCEKHSSVEGYSICTYVITNIPAVYSVEIKQDERKLIPNKRLKYMQYKSIKKCIVFKEKY